MKTLFTLLVLITSFKILPAQVSQEWVSVYNYPGSTGENPRGMVVDNSGYIYITATSGGFYVTIKYNSLGDSLWVKRYNGPGNLSDQATSIAVDESGNVYVTGTSAGIGTNYDYATIKYNSLGIEQWIQRYNGPGNGYDYPSSIAVDELGNVYVTGSSEGISTFSDYATIKYNSAGIVHWVQRYNGPDSLSDFAESIALDGLGNVFVTGSSSVIGNTKDYLTIKYNTSGDEQWEQRYNGPSSNSNDQARAIVVDDLGNSYVTGSESNFSRTYYLTLKYSSDGIPQWLGRYNGPFNSQSSPSSLKVDGFGNVYVTGSSESFYATIKYNSDGDSLWVKRYTKPGSSGGGASSIAIDGFSNVYVTGSIYETGTRSNYVSIKYNSFGDTIWVKKYNGVTNETDEAKSILVDHFGNVYVTGSSDGIGSNSNIATIKYSQSTGINQISSSIPELFRLFQNYPNPFNPSTKINFEISKSSYTNLIVYDILGKAVLKLVDQQLQPGTYEVDFNGSGLNSGIYFYRLETGSFSESRRMLLLK